MLKMIINLLSCLSGSFIDCGALIVASTLGCVVGKKLIPENLQSSIMKALGFACMLLGVSGSLDVNNPLFCIVSFVIGGVIGNMLQLEDCLKNVLNKIAHRLSGNSVSDKFMKGMAGYALMSVTGSMAISGPINNALTGDITILLAKTMLDITAGFLFASSYGVSVICSSIIVFLYQAGFGLLAVLISPLMTSAVIGDMSAIGSILILVMGLGILEDKDIKTMNYTPCIFIPILLHLIFG